MIVVLMKGVYRSTIVFDQRREWMNIHRVMCGSLSLGIIVGRDEQSKGTMFANLLMFATANKGEMKGKIFSTNSRGVNWLESSKTRGSTNGN